MAQGRGDLRPLREDSAGLSDSSDGDSDASAFEDLLFRRALAEAEQREAQAQVVDLVLDDTEDDVVELERASVSERADASAEDEVAVPSEPENAPPVPSKPPRKRLRSGRDTPKAAPVVTKAEPTECTICYDSCTISGRHRLVSLKCGHLFGKKCVERWVQVRCLWLWPGPHSELTTYLAMATTGAQDVPQLQCGRTQGRHPPAVLRPRGGGGQLGRGGHEEQVRG